MISRPLCRTEEENAARTSDYTADESTLLPECIINRVRETCQGLDSGVNFIYRRNHGGKT